MEIMKLRVSLKLMRIFHGTQTKYTDRHEHDVCQPEPADAAGTPRRHHANRQPADDPDATRSPTQRTVQDDGDGDGGGRQGDTPNISTQQFSRTEDFLRALGSPPPRDGEIAATEREAAAVAGASHKQVDRDLVCACMRVYLDLIRLVSGERIRLYMRFRMPFRIPDGGEAGTEARLLRLAHAWCFLTSMWAALCRGGTAVATRK
jgi:hypothetical protein